MIEDGSKDKSYNNDKNSVKVGDREKDGKLELNENSVAVSTPPLPIFFSSFTLKHLSFIDDV